MFPGMLPDHALLLRDEGMEWHFRCMHVSVHTSVPALDWEQECPFSPGTAHEPFAQKRAKAPANCPHAYMRSVNAS